MSNYFFSCVWGVFSVCGLGCVFVSVVVLNFVLCDLLVVFNMFIGVL